MTRDILYIASHKNIPPTGANSHSTWCDLTIEGWQNEKPQTESWPQFVQTHTADSGIYPHQGDSIRSLTHEPGGCTSGLCQLTMSSDKTQEIVHGPLNEMMGTTLTTNDNFWQDSALGQAGTAKRPFVQILSIWLHQCCWAARPAWLFGNLHGRSGLACIRKFCANGSSPLPRSDVTLHVI